MENEYKIIKSPNSVKIVTDKGDYHFDIVSYEQMTEQEAVDFAIKEIEKKNSIKHYTGKTIDFKRARQLGFCEYGINDFCNQLNLDKTKEYEVEFLKNQLTESVLDEYFNECLKIFGTGIFDKWGGVKGYLKETKNFNQVLRKEFIPESDLHELACKFAESVLPIFEKEHPEDKRPRLAIEAKRKWLRGEISDVELAAASDAASDAARLATWAASDAARLATWAASDAAWYARDAAWYAARLATRDIEKEKQIAWTLEVLK